MSEHWIIPCNVKVFNIIEHFRERKTVIWKNSFTIMTGDVAYIYLGSPYSEIKYKCNVISTDVDENKLRDNAYAIPAKKSNNYFSKKEKYIEMEYVCEYPEKTFPLEDLRAHGLGQVQIQARTDRRLQQYLDAEECKIMQNGGED